MSKQSNEKKNTPGEISAIQAIISSISAARSPIELMTLLAVAKELIENFAPGNSDLKESLTSVTSRAKTTIYEMQQESIREEMKDPAGMALKEIQSIIKAAPEVEVNLSVLADVVSFAAKYSAEKPNIKDGVFGDIIRSLEAKQAKEEHREASKNRINGLKNLSEELKNPTSLSEETKQEIMKEALEFKIKIVRDENGNLEVDEKGKKALDKISTLDMQEVESKREERKARDGVDNVDLALSQGSLASFFGGDDDYFAETPKPVQEVSKISHIQEHHIKTVPEVVRETSHAVFHNNITPEIKNNKIAMEKAQENAAKKTNSNISK